MVEIANLAAVRRPQENSGIGERPQRNAAAPGHAFAPLSAIPAQAWRDLAERAVEPNGYYLPDWELAVNAWAPGRTGVSSLGAWSDALPEANGAKRLIGLLPAISLWRAAKIPLPALVAADPYGTLRTPLLDREFAVEAVTRLLEQARSAGAHALLLRDASLGGAGMHAIRAALKREGMRPRLLQSCSRACLDATRDAEALLHDALGTKKLKELRRQRHRLAEHGEVHFDVARAPADVAAAIEVFLTLEASGWKGKRGTAMIQREGDAAFIRRAAVALAERRQCELVSLRAGDTPVAAAIVLRHQSRAFYFKLGVDERFAKFSPGVQLTLDLTRHLCADPDIASADSTASPDHPMINPIWRGRFAIGDVLIPLRPRDPVVTLVHAALATQGWIWETARRAVRAIRHR